MFESQVERHSFCGIETLNDYMYSASRWVVNGPPSFGRHTVKLNEVRPDVIKLQLFPFSLRDTIASWFESLSYGSVNTWDELVEAFMGRFFPHALTSERRGEIIIFKEGDDESLYNA